MGKKRDKHKHEKHFLITAVIGLLLMCLPIIYYSPSYDDLSTKQIQVACVGYVPGGRYASRTDHLITTDGERMEIRGNYSYIQLEKTLKPNTIVTVKYYRGLFYLWMTDYIYELTYNGEKLVTYGGDAQVERQLVMIVVGVIVILLGFVLYNAQTGFVKKQIRKSKAKCRGIGEDTQR